VKLTFVIAAGKKGTDLPGQIARKVDQNILRKLASQVDDIVFISCCDTYLAC
jgi:hypothetical protein